MFQILKNATIESYKLSSTILNMRNEGTIICRNCSSAELKDSRKDAAKRKPLCVSF